MRYLIYGMLILCGLVFPVWAEDLPQAIPPFPHSCSETPYGAVCLHVFGGAKTTIPLVHVKDDGCDGTTAQLVQLSTRLAAPIGTPVSLKSPRCDQIAIALPDVKEKTIFRVVVKPKATSENNDTLIAVYPRDLWEPLQEWSEKNQLVVNDRSGKLTSILDARTIKYSPITLPETKHSQQICIWVAGKETESPLDCNALLMLHESSSGLPHINTRTFPDKTRTDVYMPMLDMLSTHPLMQAIFIQLIQSNLRGE